MVLGLWLINGVVFFIEFDFQNINLYHCKKVMQLLTGQYPQIYTYKLRVYYNDFIAVSDTYGTVKLITLKKAYQILNTTLVPITNFAGNRLLNATVRLHQGNFLPTTDNAEGQFNALNAQTIPGQGIGSFLPCPPRFSTISGKDVPIMPNTLLPTDIYATLKINNGATIAGLTNGVFEVWIQTVRQA